MGCGFRAAPPALLVLAQQVPWLTLHDRCKPTHDRGIQLERSQLDRPELREVEACRTADLRPAQPIADPRLSQAAAIRRGDLLQADMIQQRLTADTRLVAVAAATYWQARPPCQAPQDLHGHDCIRIRSLTTNSIRPWHFACSGEHLDVRVTGSLVVDTTSLALEAACAGAGIAYLALDHLQQPLADGRLHPVLQDWSAPRPGLFLYHPGRRHVPAALKLLTRFLRSRGTLRTPASLVTPGIAGKHGSTR